MAPQLNAKRLELLRDIIPSLRRVAIIANPEHPGSEIERTYSEETAQKLGLETEFFSTAREDQLTAAFAAMNTRPPQAISLFADGFAIQYRQRIIEYGMRHHAPLISGWPIFVPSSRSHTDDWPTMWIASSRAFRHPICQLSSQPSSRW
jgi:putative ABC transport system substrate-binding protein